MLVDDEEATFSCIVDIICDKIKQKPWIVAVYRSLERKMYAKYGNNQQCRGPAVNDAINKIAVVFFELTSVLVYEKGETFACIVGRICDEIKQQPWIVVVYWLLERQICCKYVNNQQHEGPAVHNGINKISVV